MSMSSRPTLVGKQLDEYRLEALLGEGGMASVYRAVDVRLNRYVAIKVIQTSFRDNSSYVMRFEREAQAIAQLQHPNIITLYRFGDKDGLLYLAMQYVEGADLATVIDSFRRDNVYIDYDEVVRLAHEIGEALDYAHSRGVIHRDIKPHNIMVNSDNHAIVTDFGLALMTELGTQGEIFGSPHYIAPEQAISSAGVVPQSDLYAFAVVIYEMLTNSVPFDAGEPLDIAMMHMSDPLPSPRQFRPELPEAVEQVLFKALAKTPQERYETGKALARALEAALLGRKPAATAIKAAPVTIAERVAVERAANPLPPIPAVSPAAPPPARKTAPAAPAAPARTVPATTLTTRAPNSRLPIYAGLGVVGLIILILVFALLGGGQSNQGNLVATQDGAAVVAENPTSTDAPTQTITPTASPEPTQTPQPTAFVPTTQPTDVIVPQLLRRGRGLTTGERVRNGQFEVEGYCTYLNASYQTEEDGVNWYCTLNGARVLTLTQVNFDEICRLTYDNPDAFAIQAIGSQPPAYSWLCFENASP